jgi:GT2 family glycosyltransferase
VKVSVVIATYRRPDGLHAAVESLRRQTRVPDEIVIAMTTADRLTRPVVETLLREQNGGGHPPVIRVAAVREQSVAAKENAGIAIASGTIVCFMDDDAVARPDWIERLTRHFADSTVGAVGGRDVIWHADRAPERAVKDIGRLRWFGRILANHHQFATGVRDVEFLKGCDMGFRRDLLVPIDPQLVGLVPYGFEIDLGLTIRDRRHRVLYDPEASVDHFATSDMSAARADLAYITNHNQTYILLKHLPWVRRIAFLLYTFLVGDRNTIGLLRVPALVLGHGWSWDSVAGHFRGKVAGIRTFAKRGRRP